MSENQKNVLGENLEECSLDPLTGWYRDGCCNTDENDHGLHTVCAKVTNRFLEWSKSYRIIFYPVLVLNQILDTLSRRFFLKTLKQ